LGSVLVPQPEQEARKGIDRLLTAAGWLVCDFDKTNIHYARGVSIREFPMSGHGFADYLLDEFRNGPLHHIAVTVDMFTTGTDIKAGGRHVHSRCQISHFLSSMYSTLVRATTC